VQLQVRVLINEQRKFRTSIGTFLFSLHCLSWKQFCVFFFFRSSTSRYQSQHKRDIYIMYSHLQ